MPVVLVAYAARKGSRVRRMIRRGSGRERGVVRLNELNLTRHVFSCDKLLKLATMSRGMFFVSFFSFFFFSFFSGQLE
jgi:hypothetical protein